MSTFLNNRMAPLMFLITVACGGGSDSVDPHAKSSMMSPAMAEAAAVSTTSTLLARSTFSDPNNQTFDVKRINDDWQVQIKSKPAFDMAVQTISFPSGSASGWHTHPGPVFIQVTSGTVTFYQSDDPTCSPQVRTVGEGFLDLGEHPHIAVNQTNALAQTVVVYFAPPGAALKIMESEPPNCSF